MRRAPFDKNNGSAKRSIFSELYGFASSKDVECRRTVNYTGLQQERNILQRSVSADNVVIRSRGFKPSDRHDPVKRNFLEKLTSKILHFDMESGETTPINLQKLLTPASDSRELLQTKNKKMFASSYFYAPTHPTVEDQVELARRISNSLSDVRNMKSKGQSMYVNRKKRSVKWIHDGNGIAAEEEPSSPVHKDKVPLKCVMNPCGKVLDIHGIQALGEEVNIEPMPSHPEKLFDIVRDLNNQRGRGAEIFAKRRKRSEKWVVDKDQPQTPSTPGRPKASTYLSNVEMNGGTSKLSSLPPLTPLSGALPSASDKPFYNPFTVDLSLDNTSEPTTTGKNQPCCSVSDCRSHTTEVKKIYLREVAVGTDTDFPIENRSRSSVVEKSRRILFDSNERQNGVNRSNAFGNRRDSGETTRSNNKTQSYKENGSKGNREHVKQRFANYEGKISEKERARKQRKDISRSESEESEYTPVPVKQLIQEFEKTCRPVLQYKQISPKVIPIVQQCPFDNDIARFFKTRNPVKYERENTYTGSVEPEPEPEQDKDRGKLESRRSNGYISTDETEYTTDGTDSHSDCSTNERLISHLTNGEYSSFYQDEYYQRRESTTSQELEALCANGDTKFVNDEAEVPAQAKSYLLSMVASQEDILATIKHLRSTPVLDNLLSGASPDCKFTDVYQDGTKLYENDEYKGPKLSNLYNLANYNTAPRGWNQSLTYYRPVKFEKQQDTIVYSDF